MKKVLLPMLCVCVLLLSGCGDQAVKARFDQFSRALAVRDDLCFDADLRAEYADKTVDFRLRCLRTPDGYTVTVLAPEIIRGISARMDADGSELEYDGLLLDTGDLSPYGLTPLSALPRLAETLTRGHMDSQWEEDGLLVLQLLLDDHSAATVWFEPEGMIPVRAELMEDGSVKVFCDISDWS